VNRIPLDTHPDRYRHWKLEIEGRVATLRLDVRDEETYRPGYELKLNSYDLGVDIELADAIERLRFEHPEVNARSSSPARRTACSRRARTSSCSGAPITPSR
jgi:benzoyl-CoA-dihydrodiol lyase